MGERRLEVKKVIRELLILHTLLMVKSTGIPLSTLHHGRRTSRVCGSQRLVADM